MEVRDSGVLHPPKIELCLIVSSSAKIFSEYFENFGFGNGVRFRIYAKSRFTPIWEAREKVVTV